MDVWTVAETKKKSEGVTPFNFLNEEERREEKWGREQRRGKPLKKGGEENNC